jgi:glyoxylase-like metal-dependent hydrolase (beta-lactamase superfamily II)
MTIPEVHAFFDEVTFTVSYVVCDPSTKTCAIVDSVLDYDPASGRTSNTSADKVVAYITKNDLKLEWILETHVHADHISAALYIKTRLGGQIVIGAHVTQIQKVFGKIFNVGNEFRFDGAQFDRLLGDGDKLPLGSMEVHAMYTPGHTPACVTYVIGDAAFVGDTLFMPDYGTARTDFPGGDARILYHSIQQIFSLPSETRLFMCHDYKAPGRDKYAWETTVAEQSTTNVHIHSGVSEDEFVSMRETRDAQLTMPSLILPAVQVNMRAGQMPPPEDNGQRYFKIPIDAF